MKIADYQAATRKTAIYVQAAADHVNYCSKVEQIKLAELNYCALGLSGESSEVAGKVSKILRDKTGLTSSIIEELGKELGDVCYFLSETATTLGLDLEKIMEKNIEKLKKRQEKGVLGGSGDSR